MNFKEKLKLSLGEDVVKDDEETLLRHSKDSSDHPSILPSVVILPRNLNDVIRAVEILYSERIPITPRGSGTSLTGGSIPSEGGAVISLERMNKIKEIDEENLTATVEPGVITGDLINEVEKFNLFYPPDPASLQSCTIGGNVAENAGGPRAFKYGTTKNYVLEIEAVIKKGERIRIGKKTKKWVVGYDLPSLFVGSEGYLWDNNRDNLKAHTKTPKVLHPACCFWGWGKSWKIGIRNDKKFPFPYRNRVC
jgi:FAD/FMN-containing dehydrogenase